MIRPRAAVHALHGFDDGGPVFDMADDIDVGQIGHNQSPVWVGGGGLDRRGHGRGGHLRNRVVIGHTFRRRDDHPILPRKDHVAFAVEEKADVDRFFGLGDFQLR